MLRPAPSGSLPMLGDGKPPPHILTDSHDNPFTDGEIEARGLGFGTSASGPTFFSDSNAFLSPMPLYQGLPAPSTKGLHAVPGLSGRADVGGSPGPLGWVIQGWALVFTVFTALTSSLMGTSTSRPLFSVWIRMKELL